MRKTVSVLIGILSPAFYYLVMHLMLIWDYNEKYATLQNILLIILPAIPGISIAFLLTRNSLSDFFKSFGISLFASLCVILIDGIFHINLMIYTHLTGYKNFSLGEGLLVAITSASYIVSCFCGVIFAGVVSIYKQRRNNPIQN